MLGNGFPLTYGTLAARPAAGVPTAGRLYLATDAGKEGVWEDTGSDWHLLLPLTSGSGALATSLGAALAAAGFSNPLTAVADLLIGGTVTNGVAAPARLAKGAAGTAVFSNGTTLVFVAAPQWAAVPATAGATGTAGQMAYDTGFLYVCVATNTWLKVAIATW